MSTYARDKLKRYVMREEIAKFKEELKVSDMLDHLPCLTLSDREEIEATERNDGKRAAVPRLLQCLTRRENWAKELILALEACEHTVLAADLRRVYDSLNNQGNPKPNAPAAHVHRPPPPTYIQAAEGLPLLAPPEPAAQVSPPPAASAQPESETPPSLAAEASAKAASSSDPAPQAPQSPPIQAVHPHATPPASPETPHHPTATTSPSPPPVHQEPEESFDVDLQVVPGDMGPGTDEASDGDSEVSGVSSEESPDPEPPVEETPDPKPPVKPLVKLHAVAATLQPHPVQTATPDASPPQTPSPPQSGFDETDESTSIIMTPDKCPVQETVPPKDHVTSAVLEPEEHSDPIATQITENCQHTVSTGTSTLPVDGQNAFFIDEDDRELSKPGQLLSYQPLVSNSCQVGPGRKEAPYSGTSARLQISDSVQTTQVHHATPTPYSGNTTCLEFSEAAADSELTTQDSAPAVPCSGAILVHQATPTPSPQPCQENGVVEELLPPNEPEENQYESLDNEVLVNVVHVSEPPSIQNQDGQMSETKPNSAPGLPATAVRVSFNAASNENCQPSESRAAEVVLELKPQDPVEEKPSSSMRSYVCMTAVGVVIFAMLMAWKLKH